MARAQPALDATGRQWQVERAVVRSLRSGLPGTIRLPIGLLERSGTGLRGALGRFAYPRGALVHRMGLSLPPAPVEVVTLHDVVAWRFPDEGARVATAGAELRAAAAVICVSEATASDARQLFGLTNTRVVHPGVDDRFRHAQPLDAGTRSRLGLPSRYILHAGGASERKNLTALAQAWQRITERHPDVILALSGPQHPRRDQLFGDLPRVVRLGRVDAQLVPSLIAGAELVVVPSLYEGFGLPVLEAMAAGTVVVAAATSSLPEVAGDAAVLVEPSAAGVAEGIESVLSGEVDSDVLRALGRKRSSEFTWERSAAGHAAAWNEVVG